MYKPFGDQIFIFAMALGSHPSCLIVHSSLLDSQAMRRNKAPSLAYRSSESRWGDRKEIIAIKRHKCGTMEQ